MAYLISLKSFVLGFWKSQISVLKLMSLTAKANWMMTCSLTNKEDNCTNINFYHPSDHFLFCFVFIWVNIVHLDIFSCCVKWIASVHTTCRIKNKNQLILSIAHHLDPFGLTNHCKVIAIIKKNNNVLAQRKIDSLTCSFW